jgi:hypothetical protein
MRAHEFILEMDPSRRGFLKKLGKTAAGVAGAAALSALPSTTAQAAKYLNDRECTALWRYCYEVRDAAIKGRDKQEIEDRYFHAFIGKLNPDMRNNRAITELLRSVIDLALSQKHTTPKEFAQTYTSRVC